MRAGFFRALRDESRNFGGKRYKAAPMYRGGNGFKAIVYFAGASVRSIAR